MGILSCLILIVCLNLQWVIRSLLPIQTNLCTAEPSEDGSNVSYLMNYYASIYEGDHNHILANKTKYI